MKVKIDIEERYPIFVIDDAWGDDQADLTLEEIARIKKSSIEYYECQAIMGKAINYID